MECSLAECKSCERLRDEGKSDNTQIQRLGITPKATKRVITQKMGDSLALQVDYSEGDVMIGFVGNVILRDRLEAEHDKHIVEMHEFKFKLKKDCDKYKRGHVWEGDFVMDCCDYGNDANFVNSTCNNNNSQCYCVIVDGIPIPALYAFKSGKKGLYMFSPIFENGSCCLFLYTLISLVYNLVFFSLTE